MSHTLSDSGVFMGATLNKSGDLVPAEELYEACRVFGRYVEHRGGMDWDFSTTHTMPIDPAFTRLVESYLASVLTSENPARGWKLPETTLILPWIVRLFPEVRYIYWVRDPRDGLLGSHLTDDLERFGVPHETTGDLRRRRVASWLYQYQIMRQTPTPAHRIDIRFEEFVMCQDSTLRRLELFLGLPMAKIEVRPESVGRWRSEEETQDVNVFPAEALYLGPVSGGHGT